jgi:hypothetical protein
MCEKCVEIDEKMVRYQRLAEAVRDQRTTEAADELLARLRAVRRALHPEK